MATEFYKVNVMNQYTEVASDSAFDILSYTQVGNLANFDGWNYVYDAHNRLIEANGPSTAVVLSYDAIGRLTRTVHNGQVIDYLYDGNELVAEYNSVGSLLRRYVHGLGDDDPVIRYEGAGTSARRYLLADERGGTATAVTNPDASAADIAIATVAGAAGAGTGAKIANKTVANLEKMEKTGGISANIASTTRSAGNVSGKTSAGAEAGKIAADTVSNLSGKSASCKSDGSC